MKYLYIPNNYCHRFTLQDDEDWRLAKVIYRHLQGSWAEQVASWIKLLIFPIEREDFFTKISNFRSCLVEVYPTYWKSSLQDDLKEAISLFDTRD